MPVLLDALTIIFIVGGLGLLWMNLRGLRARSSAPAPTDHNVAPVHINKDQSAGTAELDIAASRSLAEQCLDEADRSTNRSDREAWLRMGVEWIRLAEGEDRRNAEQAKSAY